MTLTQADYYPGRDNQEDLWQYPVYPCPCPGRPLLYLALVVGDGSGGRGLVLWWVIIWYYPRLVITQAGTNKRITQLHVLSIPYCTHMQLHSVYCTLHWLHLFHAFPPLYCSVPVFRYIVYISLLWLHPSGPCPGHPSLHCTVLLSTGTLCALHYPDYTICYFTFLQVHCVHYTTVITGVSANCSVMETQYLPVQCHYMLLMSIQCSRCTALFYVYTTLVM